MKTIQNELIECAKSVIFDNLDSEPEQIYIHKDVVAYRFVNTLSNGEESCILKLGVFEHKGYEIMIILTYAGNVVFQLPMTYSSDNINLGITLLLECLQDK